MHVGSIAKPVEARINNHINGEVAQRDFFIDTVFDSPLFKKLIALFHHFTFIFRTGMGLPGTGASFCWGVKVCLIH